VPMTRLCARYRLPSLTAVIVLIDFIARPGRVIAESMVFCGDADSQTACLPSALSPYSPLRERTDATAIARYLETCKSHQVEPSADVLAQLQLGHGELKMWRCENFGDLHLRVLVSLLEDDDGAELALLRKLDLSGCNLGPSGMMLVGQLLRHPSCQIDSLDVSFQAIGPAGVSALVSALLEYPNLRSLRMHSCELGDDGARVVAGLLQNATTLSMRNLETQNNFISFEMCTELTGLAAERGVDLNLNGNRVFDEVMNAVSHGVGLALAIIGTVLLIVKVRDREMYVKRSVGLYCSSLIAMYLCSTMFHALFATGHKTVYIFGIFDYSAIFLLIAGSYTPFFGILFHGERWAQVMLVVQWSAAVLGIFTTAFCTGPGAVLLRVALYVVMGWTAVSCIVTITRAIGRSGSFLLVLGGLFYTGGIPFFLRGEHTLGVIPDHTIWHVFVVLGTATHFLCIYVYVVPEDPSHHKGILTDSESEIEQVEDYTKMKAGAV